MRAKQIHHVEKACQLSKARIFKKWLGVTAAAEYMRDRGWSVEAAAFFLSRR